MVKPENKNLPKEDQYMTYGSRVTPSPEPSSLQVKLNSNNGAADKAANGEVITPAGL